MTPDPQRPSLTIVLPAYNEAERIGPALDELFGWLFRGGPARSYGRSSAELGDWDVLVVDDGSEDDTADLIEARPEAQPGPDGEPPRLRVLRRPHAGKGGAVTAGVLSAEGDLVVFTDADMATPPDQIPLLVEALIDHDVALGSRIQPDGSDRRASQPAYRRLLGRIYRLIAGAWVTGDVADTQCGFKGFQRGAGLEVFSRLKTTGIAFDAEVIFLTRRLGYEYAVVPVMWHDIHGSRMQVRLSLALGVLWDLFRIPLLHRDVRALKGSPSASDPA
jgi:dolichyl-phosphate beta-glucosyltransferase